ncbi:hypothetical protein [Paenisporosarcina sp. TG-14]|uniref:hypothetical protein n=1 Tax=Paenisporosarcina sp. TG-14 TaxID=1231057 RepID=UPI00030E87A3|nr:hypothetical protein [Paenisporosarcina sp. TG-14]
MLNIAFDPEALRSIIREEVRAAVSEAVKTKELPILITRKELMELFHISQTKVTELLGRSDFPVMREAGILIPTHLLFKWIERNTNWVEDNTSYFSSVG